MYNHNQSFLINKALSLINKEHQNELYQKGGEFSTMNHTKKFFVDPLYPPITYYNSLKDTRAILLPHAGTRYVQSNMNYIFEGIPKISPRDRWFNKIIIITTNHQDPNNYIPKTGIQNYNGTNLLIDSNTSANDLGLIQSDDHFKIEHSYLSAFPYIQKLGFMPIILLSIGKDYTPQLLNRLISIMNDGKTLLIANTDLLHCGTIYNTDCPSDIDKYNKQTIQNILNNLSETFIEHMDHFDPSKKVYNPMCGPYAVKLFAQIISSIGLNWTEYIYNSSDRQIPSDNNTNQRNKQLLNGSKRTLEGSVGYSGIIYNQSGIPDLKHSHYLLSFPRRFVNYIFKQRDYQSASIQNLIRRFRRGAINMLDSLYIKDVAGAFITMNKVDRSGKKSLRGCIGTFAMNDHDVIDIILTQTYKTVFNDSRFSPLTLNEFNTNTFQFKINYLKSPRKLSSIDKSNVSKEIRIGIDGITAYFSDGRSATYLASVLSESFGITQQNIENKFDTLIESLREKSGSSGSLQSIELYECSEFDEPS